MKLGLVTDSLVDRSLAEAAAVCRGLGLEQVELGTGCWILWGKTASRSPP